MYYDLDEMKKGISCVDVCSQRGIALKKKGDRFWGKIRSDDKTNSFSIRNNNLWYDFGDSAGGSVIDLVMKLDGLSMNDAVDKLAQEYGYATLTEENKWYPLTDNQYLKLNIEPVRVTMNFEYDLNKHSAEQLSYWNSKYNMTVGELAKAYPEQYDKLITAKGGKVIKELSALYKDALSSISHQSSELETGFAKIRIGELEKAINERVALLKRALINKGVFDEYKKYRVKASKDMEWAFKKRHEVQVNILTDLYKDTDMPISSLSATCLKSLYDINIYMYGSNLSNVLNKADIPAFQKEIGNAIKTVEEDLKQSKTEEANNELKKTLTELKKTYDDVGTVVQGLNEIKLKEKSISTQSCVKAIEQSMVK